MPKFIIFGSSSSALPFAKVGKILTGCDCMKRRLSAVFEELCLDKKITFLSRLPLCWKLYKAYTRTGNKFI
jgi:hypothetical protein